MYTQLNAKEEMITNISIWGIQDNPNLQKDSYNYNLNGTYCGLYTEEYEKKASYYKVLEVLQAE